MNKSIPQIRLNIVFYSSNCKFSTELLTLMKNENILQNFKMICVDGNIASIPKHITKVPAIITSDTNRLYMADDAFKWLHAVKYMRQSVKDNNIITKKNESINQPIDQRTFISSEMTGISDNFAYTNIDTPLPKSFMGYKDDDKHTIFTAPNETHKLDEKSLKSGLRDITNNIANQVKESRTKMMDGQIIAIQRAEKNIK